MKNFLDLIHCREFIFFSVTNAFRLRSGVEAVYIRIKAHFCVIQLTVELLNSKMKRLSLKKMKTFDIETNKYKCINIINYVVEKQGQKLDC